MRRLVRGATSQQTFEDLERILGTVKLYEDTPDIANLSDGEVAVVRGTGNLIFRDGADVYQVTGTKIN